MHEADPQQGRGDVAVARQVAQLFGQRSGHEHQSAPPAFGIDTLEPGSESLRNRQGDDARSGRNQRHGNVRIGKQSVFQQQQFVGRRDLAAELRRVGDPGHGNIAARQDLVGLPRGGSLAIRNQQDPFGTQGLGKVGLVRDQFAPRDAQPRGGAPRIVRRRLQHGQDRNAQALAPFVIAAARYWNGAIRRASA